MTVLASRFAHTRYIQRSKGGAACRTAAYNGRTRIFCQRTQTTFDFSNRPGLYRHIVVIPSHVHSQFLQPHILWNTVEHFEKRQDSQVAKELLLRLPNTIPSPQWMMQLVQQFIMDTFVADNLAAQIDLHTPPYQENLNWHAHILLPTRRFLADGHTLSAKKATDLDPPVRGASHFITHPSQIREKWFQAIEEFCKNHHFPCLVAHAQKGSLYSEGPRYTPTPQYVQNHNATVHAQRTQAFGHPNEAMQTLLARHDIFSLEDLRRLWNSHLFLEHLQDLLSQPDCVSLGNTKSQQHYGIFTSKNMLQSLWHNRQKLQNHPRVTKETLTHDHPYTPHKKWLSYTHQRSSLIIPNAHTISPSHIVNLLDHHPQASIVLQGHHQHGPSSFLWGSPNNHPSIQICANQNDAIEQLLHQWHNHYRTDPHARLLTTSHQLDAFNHTARAWLKKHQQLSQKDIYLATTTGSKPFAQNDHIIYQTHQQYFSGIIKDISLKNLTICCHGEEKNLETHHILPIRYAYTTQHPHPQHPSFALYTPPSSPPPCTTTTHVVTSQEHFSTQQDIIHALNAHQHSIWAPHLQPIHHHSFVHQYQRVHTPITDLQNTLYHILNQCMHKARHLPHGVQHMSAHMALFHHIWSHQPIDDILRHYHHHILTAMATWKALPHPISPINTLKIEQGLYGLSQYTPEHCNTQRHNTDVWRTIIRTRHQSPLSITHHQYAEHATRYAFAQKHPANSWQYYQACQQQEWCFYHLMRHHTLPPKPPPISAFYYHYQQQQSHKMFDSAHSNVNQKVRAMQISLDH